MKLKEIIELTEHELRARKRELRQENFHLRMQQQGGQLEKSSQFRSIRKEVAWIETVISQRRLKKEKANAS